MNNGSTKHLTASQIRAARGVLNWSQEELAEASTLSIATIRKLELGNISPRGNTNQLICQAFENAGLEFIEPNGVRQRPEEIFVYQGEDGVKEFFDDVYETSLKTGLDVVQVWSSSQSFYDLVGDYRAFHAERMMAARDRFAVKAIVTETFDPPPSPYCEGRFLSRHFVDSVPFYVYGDKYAIIPVVSGDNKKIIVIHSREAAKAFRLQFDSMWDKASQVEGLKGEKAAPKKR